jgi:hypothetical protein
MKAFPLSNMTGLNQQGMDLRDYFAAAIVQALLTTDTIPNRDVLVYAKAAYEAADAMMLAREVQPSQTARQFTADETLKGRG